MLSRNSLGSSHIMVSRHLLRMGICMENPVGLVSFDAKLLQSDIILTSTGLSANEMKWKLHQALVLEYDSLRALCVLSYRIPL